MPLSARLLDKIRRYWILQVAIPYGIATFLIVLALFHSSLPLNPWERMFSPTLIAPSIASVVVVYRILTKHKKISDADGFIFKYYTLGMGLAAMSIIIAIVAEKL
jgi:hypothetical protein